MKYSNLLLYLLKWNDLQHVRDIKYKPDYEMAMKDSVLDKKYKDELKAARQEYLEYLTDPEYHGNSHD